MPLIAIIDDQTTNRSILSRLAQSLGDGVEVHAFAGPLDALAWTAANTPDLVVTDFSMPAMSGAEFVTRFRAQPECANVPVMVVTAYEDLDFRYRALDAGATDFLHSPVDEREFRVRARNLLTIRGQQKLIKNRARALESELRETDRRFRLLVESVVDYAIVMLDANGHVTSWNAGAERIVGYRGDEALGLPCSAFYTEADQRSGRPACSLAEAAQAGRFDEEAERVRGDGSRFWAHEVTVALADDGGAPAGFAKIVRDITERREFENSLQTAKEQAESASRAKTRFMAHMSHELRTPLNSIIGLSEMITNRLAGTPVPQRYVEYGRDIHASGLHLLQLIEDILDLSQLELGKVQLSEQSVAVPAVARAVLSLMQGPAEESGVQLVLDVPADLPPLLADEHALKQILVNLVSNAIKFTPREGTVRIGAGVETDGLFVLVKDSGIGIAPEEIARVLQPFEPPTRAAQVTGTGAGLGLPIVRSLVELHQGAVRLDSAAGAGTTATVLFPAARILSEPATWSRAGPG